MRILRVAQTLYPDVTGGGAYHVHAMSRDQASMGHDVTVLTVDRTGERQRVSTRDGYTVVRYPVTVEPLGNAISAGVAKHLCTAGSFDVIHAHSHLYFSTNLAAVVRRLDSTALAITNHGLYSQTAPERIFDWYLRTLGRWTFNSADVVFCYSETDRNRLHELGVGADISVVPNGIDVRRFSPEGPATDLIPADTLAVLFVGRLTDGKRPADAIKAISSVQNTHPNVHLYLAGDGDRRADLRSLAEDLGVTEAVTFLGHVDYDEMPALYRGADVLVLPSRAEGMPRTVLEALSTELPVVTTDLPQLGPLTDVAGSAVPVGEPAELAAALSDVLDDPERASEMGARGRNLVTEQYTWDNTVRETTNQLDALME